MSTKTERAPLESIVHAVETKFREWGKGSEALRKLCAIIYHAMYSYGPSQVRNMLKRERFRVLVGTVRHVMEKNGYFAPSLKRKEHVGRYEAARPRNVRLSNESVWRGYTPMIRVGVIE